MHKAVKSLLGFKHRSPAFMLTFITYFIITAPCFSMEATLSWDNNADAAYYIVYWGKQPGNYTGSSQPIDSPATQYTAKNLDDDKYYFAVKAFNACGNSSDYSDEATNDQPEYSVKILPTPDTTSITAGESVVFTAESFGGKAPIRFQWNFGSAVIPGSSGRTTEAILFENAGSYTISVTATDTTGVSTSNSIILNVKAPDTTPDVLIIHPTADLVEAYPGAAISFFGETVNGNPPLTNTWSVDSTVVAEGSDTLNNYLFESPGFYTITLTVTDADGDTGSASTTVNIFEAPNDPGDSYSVSILSTPDTSTITAGDSVVFTTESSGGRAPMHFQWDFGSPVIPDSSGITTEMILFENTGTYTITVTATDATGVSTSDSFVLHVKPQDSTPDVTITHPTSDLVEAYPGAKISFFGETVNGNTPLTYTWSVDSTVVAEGSDSLNNYLFESPGLYTITFTVTDTDGDTGSDSTTVNIFETPNDPGDSYSVSILSTPDTSTITAGDSVVFTAESSGGSAPIRFQWDFGSPVIPDSSGITTQATLFENTGTYTITVTATDTTDLSISNSIFLNVNPPDTIPDVTIIRPTADLVEAYPGAKISFFGETVNGNPPLTYTWSVDNSVIASGSDVLENYIFESPGLYTITFTVTDADGDTGSASTPVSISENPDNNGDSGDSGGMNSPILPDRPRVYFNYPTNAVPETFLLEASAFQSDNHRAFLTESHWQIFDESGTDSTLIYYRILPDTVSTATVPMFILDERSDYSIRVQHVDNQYLRSEYSTPISFTTNFFDHQDYWPINGTPDAQDVTFETDLDHNGLADSNHQGMYRLLTLNGTIIGLLPIANVAWIEKYAWFEDPGAYGTNTELNMPYGYIAFRLQTIAPGDTAKLNVYFDVPIPPGSKWYKNDPVKGWAPYAGAELNTEKGYITLSVTDGGPGDSDGVVNGIIVDPGGLWVPMTHPSGPSFSGREAMDSGCFIQVSGSQPAQKD